MISGQDQLRLFMMKGLQAVDAIDQLEHLSVYTSTSRHRLGKILSELSFAEFSLEIQNGAEKMSRLYVAFYCFENSARELIAQTMHDAHGDKWWDTKVPANIKSKVANRMEQETKNKWHQPRSRQNIDYTDFGDMPGIIVNNWVDFEDLFDSQEWVKTRFSDMEKSRNVIAHNNELMDTEVERIKLYLRDWARIAGL